MPATTLALRERMTTRNAQTAAVLAEGFVNQDSTATEGPKTIVEAFPGECSFSVGGAFGLWCE